MRKLLLTTAAVGMLAATGASAQVLTEVNALIDSVIEGTSNVALAQSVAVNTSEIDGSITINGTGAVAGSEIINDIQSEIGSASGVSFAVEGVAADALVGESSINIASGIESLGVLCDIESAGDGSGAGCVIGADTVAFNNLVDTTVSNIVDTTTSMSFGEVSATALGAVNSGAVEMAINGAATASSSASKIGTGAADAAFSSLDAASVVATSAAVNTNDVDGFVSVTLASTSADFTSITTTAAGAINSGDVNGSVNGVLDSIIGE